MIHSPVKRLLREDGLALVGQIGSLGGIAMVELVGHAGFDGVFIDMEHTGYGLSDVQVMIVAAERVGITPIVRTPGFDRALILRLLDMGAGGIQIPHISDAADAGAVVEAVRYPPRGHRGMFGASRAANYGNLPLLQHMERSNRELVLILMIENQRGIDQIEAIASTEGVDVVSVGPADLARALGASGRPDHPDLAAAVQRIAAKVRSTGRARLGFPVGNPAFPLTIPELKQLGAGYVICSPPPEIGLLRAMTQQVEGFRRQMADG